MSSITVDIHEAKAQLSRLVDQASAGEEIIIARDGKPVARLLQLAAPTHKVRFGVLKSQIKVAADFDARWLDEVIASFEEPSCASCWIPTCFFGPSRQSQAQ